MEIKTDQQIHPNVIRQLMLLALVIGLGYLLYDQMAFMLGAFLGAVALYMLMRKPMFKMVYQWKTKKMDGCIDPDRCFPWSYRIPFCINHQHPYQ